MKRVLYIAGREFASTVLTKGFLFGVLMLPIILVVIIGASALVRLQPPPRVVGAIGIVDRSGATEPFISPRFAPEADKAELKELTEKATEAAEKVGLPPGQLGMASQAIEQEAARALSSTDLTVQYLAPDADAEQLRKDLGALKPEAWQGKTDERPIVALVVIPESAVKAPAEASGPAPFEEFELYFPARLDAEVRSRIERRIAAGIVDARIAAELRFEAGGLTPERVKAILAQPSAREREITSSGAEKVSNPALQMILPAAFLILILVAVMTGGQYLLTTTIEEKSSRVMEVLLSAVSPMQLMVGKILGQMGAALVILCVYSGLGMGALIVFAQGDRVTAFDLAALFVFFFVGFFTIASLMAAIGSAVTELREAQTLMTPVMMLTMLPWLLVLPISRAPNSMLSTVLSFVPVINPFVMMIRIPASGTEPIPGWQVAASVVVALLTAAGSAWAAAKIFRVGVLMYGKPPNFKTLVQWVRMA